MKNRDKQLKAIRPTLDLSPASHEIEQFQNKTLRPILKLQNELLLQLCRAQFVKRKGVFFNLESPKRLIYIEEQVSKDQKFKQLLLGLLIGHFTIEELAFFQKEEAALRKRMTSLLIQRIQSQEAMLHI